MSNPPQKPRRNRRVNEDTKDFPAEDINQEGEGLLEPTIPPGVYGSAPARHPGVYGPIPASDPVSRCERSNVCSTLTSEEKRELRQKDWTKDDRFDVDSLSKDCLRDFRRGVVRFIILQIQYPLFRDFNNAWTFFQVFARVAPVCMEPPVKSSDREFVQNVSDSLQMDSGRPIPLAAETFLLLLMNRRHVSRSIDLLWSRVPANQRAAVGSLIFSSAPGLKSRDGNNLTSLNSKWQPTTPGLISNLACELLVMHGNIFQREWLKRTFGSRINQIDERFSQPHLCVLKKWFMDPFPSARIVEQPV